ncbi:MAG: calcium-binding protein [Paracoccaceae bacterium]|nr:calcium-binding protein [Paracoccaceae bacterium]
MSLHLPVEWDFRDPGRAMVETLLLLLGVGLLAGVGLGGGSGGGDDGPDDPVLASEGENDTFEGSRFDDTFDGGPGEDTIRGRGGNDLLDGGIGSDFVDGNAGNDTVFGGPGDDELYGGEGDDTLRGEQDPDFIRGGPGDDTIFGGSGGDTIEGARGKDVIDGGDDDDNIRGGSGDDEIAGGLGADRLDGDPGADVLDGRVLSGRTDTDEGDTLIGDAGADRLILGTGDEGWGENEGAAVDGAGDTFVSGDWIDGAAPEVFDFDPDADRIELLYDPSLDTPPPHSVTEVSDATGTLFEIRLDGELVLVVRAGPSPLYTLTADDIDVLPDA